MIWLARVLRRLAEWCDPLDLRQVAVGRAAAWPRDASEEILAQARAHVLKAEQFAEGTSGEYKRAWAYGRVLKRCPAARKADVGLAVELAVQDLQRT